jgi:micrococcal nuclease
MLPLAGVAFGIALLLGTGAYAVARVDAVDGRRALVGGVALLAVGGALAVAVPAVPGAGAGTADGTDASANASGDPLTTVEGRAADPLTATGSVNATATATVVAAASGDRITYRTASGSRRTVRLAGVDAPGVGGDAPERFDGVVTGSRGRTCLADHGRRALVSLRTLVGESVTVEAVTDRPAGPVAVLHADGRSINRRVVERGHARATDDRYADAEEAARSAKRGLWSCGVVTNDRPLRGPNATGVRIAAVRPNPPGDDADSLAEEYVVVENAGRTTVDLSDWHLADDDGNRYFFFDGRELRPGERLVLHVGAGRNREGHLYWDATTPVLDNDHESLRLVDGDTDRVVKFSY